MKILIISQYFWPENFRINEIAEFFCQKGNQVEVLTGVPNYPEGEIFHKFKSNPEKFDNYKNVKIYRVNNRPRNKGKKIDLFFNYFSFFFRAISFCFFKLKRKNYDLIFSFGTSPVTNSLIGVFLSKFTKSKKVTWVLDLWPEIVFELNILNSKILRVLFIKLMNLTYNSNNIIFCQSSAFKEIISRKVKDKTKVKELFAWPEQVNESNRKINLDKFDNKILNIVFTGSIGEAQNIEQVFRIADKLNNFDIRWHIIGSGRHLDNLKQKNYSKNIIFYGHKHKDQIYNYLKKADILLITLKGGKAINSTIPGKFQTYLKFEKPILGSISGEVSKIINENKIGLCSEPDDDEKFIKNVLQYLKQKQNGLLNKVETSNLINKFDKGKILLQLNNDITNLVKSFTYLNLIYSSKDINFKNNFILSAINLAWLGYYGVDKIKINKNFIFWPDGIFYRKIYKKKIVKKITGREIVNTLEIPENINRIKVLGNLSKNSLNYLKNKFTGKIINHFQLPYGTPEELVKKIPKLEEDEVIFLTLPTPKQEQVANLLSKLNNHFKILCVGGALNMLGGDEKTVPPLIYSLNLESLWRLKYEPYRRTSRLFESLYYYILSEFNGKYNNIKEKN